MRFQTPVVALLFGLAACQVDPSSSAPRNLVVLPGASVPAAATPSTAGEEDVVAPLGLAILTTGTQDEQSAAPADTVLAQDAPSYPRGADGPPWVVIFSPYVWMLAIEGDGRIGGNEVDVDMSFGDILDELNWIIEGRIDMYRGKWGFTVDATYANLGSDVDIGAESGESDLDMGLFLLGAQYELYQGQFRDSDTRVKTEVGGGFVRTVLDSELSFDGGAPPAVKGEQEWLDVIAGTRSTFFLDQKNSIRTDLFVGGFELLGDSSDLIWGAEALYGREFGKRGNKVFWIGYRYWSIDYDPGNSFAMDIALHGPVVGLSFRY